jgi:hypothetical protein
VDFAAQTFQIRRCQMLPIWANKGLRTFACVCNALHCFGDDGANSSRASLWHFHFPGKRFTGVVRLAPCLVIDAINKLQTRR